MFYHWLCLHLPAVYGPLADKRCITRVHKPFEADTFFPEISESEWKLTENSHTYEMEDGSFSYTFESYIRKS